MTRREFLETSILGPAAFVLVSAAETKGACGAGGPTPAQTAGPYWKPASPERTTLLEPGMAGTRLVLEGAVLGPDCRPVPRARLDFWQADARGRYDNAGHTLRGHQLTDAEGRYRLETVLPGLYPGRTRHIHVIVSAPGYVPLTTQIYFAGEPGNAADGLWEKALEIPFSGDEATGLQGVFPVVLRPL